MADEVRINGNQYSWGSIILKMQEQRFHGFTAISYSDSRERVMAYGMGRHHAPRGRSRGKYAVEPVTLTGWKSSLQTFRKALADAGDGENYGDTEFEIVVEYIETDESEIIVTIERCVMTKNTTSEEEGPDPLSEEVEILPFLIRRNNLTLFDNSDQTQ